MIDLILKDIDDQYIRENFFRLKNFLNAQVILDADFKFFDITINKRDLNFQVMHGLAFIPMDVIVLSASGDQNFNFRSQDFDKTSIYIAANGPVRIRFVAGKLKSLANSVASESAPFVQGAYIVTPSSPNFSFSLPGAAAPGSWLNSEGLDSSVCGVPILFSGGKVAEAVVMTSSEAAYDVGVYQHDGQGINLALLGQFSVTNGGEKIFPLSLSINYDSPNVQLGIKVISGTPSDLRVSLIVRGNAI